MKSEREIRKELEKAERKNRNLSEEKIAIWCMGYRDALKWVLED